MTSPRRKASKAGGRTSTGGTAGVGGSLRLVEVTLENLDATPRCGIKNKEHEGYRRKTSWLKRAMKQGLKARVLLTEKSIQCGYIEYTPGRYAWRGVEADGYMFIHCIWTFFKSVQGRGYARRLIQDCVDDAKRAKMLGVAVIARDRSWLADSRIFLKNGFEAVDAAPPDYQLLVKRFKKSAPAPRFKGQWDKRLRKLGKGLTIIRADQCPHTAKFADEIAEMARTTYGIKPRTVELKTPRDARSAPTPYATFAIVYDGQLLADHQISRARFGNIMDKLLG